jgi:hypothetical protein
MVHRMLIHDTSNINPPYIKGKRGDWRFEARLLLLHLHKKTQQLKGSLDFAK